MSYLSRSEPGRLMGAEGAAALAGRVTGAGAVSVTVGVGASAGAGEASVADSDEGKGVEVDSSAIVFVAACALFSRVSVVFNA